MRAMSVFKVSMGLDDETGDEEAGGKATEVALAEEPVGSSMRVKIVCGCCDMLVYRLAIREALGCGRCLLGIGPALFRASDTASV